MTLLGFEGFEHKYSPGSAVMNWSRGGLNYSTTGAVNQSSFAAGRFGGQCWRNSTYTNTVSVPMGSYGGLYVGAAFYADMARPSSIPYFGLYGPEGNARYLYVAGSALGSVTLNRDTSNAVVASAPDGTLFVAAWNYLEVYCGPFSATTGRVIVKANGNTVIDYTGSTLGSTTALDTAGNVATVTVSGGSNGGAGTASVDDVYFCDNTGPAPYNAFLGDVKVETLVPNGNGARSELLGSDGNSVDNYALVDEQPASATDYVGSASVGQRDMYAFTDLSSSSPVLAVQTNAAVLKSDAGAASMKLMMRGNDGSERQVSSVVALPSSLGWISGFVQTVDTAGANWTATSVNGTQYGVEIA